MNMKKKIEIYLNIIISIYINIKFEKKKIIVFKERILRDAIYRVMN